MEQYPDIQTVTLSSSDRILITVQKKNRVVCTEFVLKNWNIDYTSKGSKLNLSVEDNMISLQSSSL